jgi:membrane protein implicated in regulation of membrane protease activity
MPKLTLASGVLFLVLAILVLAFASGLRRWYSGIFFAVLAIVLFRHAWRSRPSEEA